MIYVKFAVLSLLFISLPILLPLLLAFIGLMVSLLLWYKVISNFLGLRKK